MKVKVFDLGKNIQAVENHYGLEMVTRNIIDLVNENKTNKNVAFVSAANSLLFMDGGSDLGYMKAIKNIEMKCKKACKLLGKVSNCGRYYLPIGSAQLIVPENSYKFISSPTMFLPQNVKDTKNPYYAMSAILDVAKFYNENCNADERIEEIYVPFLCTGYGGFEAQASLDLMHLALNNNLQFKHKNVNGVHFSVSDKDFISEQPKIYMNTEFGITYEDVLRSLN